ncbi:prepilin-type N-terminal cleavage/methylation domain-containing protein [Bacillus sp. NP157]|nr:prepilin-type N-terminal cleavage/methylation domain-containing protein [Bacillus sp. NP157]
MASLRTRKRGFTLIELMIAVAIVAILAALAVTQYSRYTYRARRGDGQKLLMALANAEERYFAQQNKYADVKTIGYAATTTATSDSGYYTATITVGAVNSFAAQSYVATAVPTGPQAKDTCGSLSITDTGLKSSTATTTNGTCW